MIPTEVTALCSELAIKVCRLSKHHFRLAFEDSDLTVDYWPSTGRIGVTNCKTCKPKNICYYIIDAWDMSFSYKKPEINNSYKMKDTDPMPFGKHKGVALVNVPDDYLLWLYNEMKDEDKERGIGLYIKENLEAIKLGAKK